MRWKYLCLRPCAISATHHELGCLLCPSYTRCLSHQTVPKWHADFATIKELLFWRQLFCQLNYRRILPSVSGTFRGLDVIPYSFTHSPLVPWAIGLTLSGWIQLPCKLRSSYPRPLEDVYHTFIPLAHIRRYGNDSKRNRAWLHKYLTLIILVGLLSVLAQEEFICTTHYHMAQNTEHDSDI